MSLICKMPFDKLEKKAKSFMFKWLIICFVMYGIFLIFEILLINEHTFELFHLLHKLYGIF